MKVDILKLFLIALLLVMFTACANIGPEQSTNMPVATEDVGDYANDSSNPTISNANDGSAYHSYYVGELSLTATDNSSLPLVDLSVSGGSYIVGKTPYYNITPAVPKYLSIYHSDWGVNLDLLEPIARSSDNTIICSSKDAADPMAFLFLFSNLDASNCVWLARDSLINISSFERSDFIAYSCTVRNSEEMQQDNTDFPSSLFEYHTADAYTKAALLVGWLEPDLYMRYVYREYPALFYNLYYIAGSDGLYDYPYILIYNTTHDCLVVVEHLVP